MGIKIKLVTGFAIALAGIWGYKAFDAMRSHPTELTPATPIATITAPAEVISKEAVATFAGGCFWCTESDFEHVEGVVSALSGYTGGTTKNPSYHEVSAGDTGHREAVKVTYDPSRISYDQLLDYFFEHIDPTDPNGQFVDQGSSYKAGIFYHTNAERIQAEAAKAAVAASGVFGAAPIVTDILPAGPFYAAEDYHQDYYTKNPIRYEYYRSRSGRDEFLITHWTKKAMEKYEAIRNATPTAPTTPKQTGFSNTTFVKPTDTELQTRLTPLQYAVTQKASTEPPFKNEYDKNYTDGMYVDIVSGEPLFSSKDKFDSGTGWPSFVKPLTPDSIIEKTDYYLLYPRTEILSRFAGSHLGHMFNDGPPDRGGKRYCMNSAALRFIPAANLEKEGYGEFTNLFR